jgi:hypothetical protein
MAPSYFFSFGEYINVYMAKFAAVGVRFVCVGGKVQRNQEPWRSAVLGWCAWCCVDPGAWCWCCSLSDFGGKDPRSSVQCDGRQGPRTLSGGCF